MTYSSVSSGMPLESWASPVEIDKNVCLIRESDQLNDRNVKSMKLLATVFTVFVALSHVGILILEMFFWNHPIGQKIFMMTPEVAESSAVLAMNQGLYNGFLAAGLFWSLLKDKIDVRIFFLICVVVAGVFGGLTAKPSIVLTQGLPALIALILTLLGEKRQRDGTS